VRAPERASEAAQEAFLRAVMHRQVTDRGDIVARAAELGVDVEGGAAVIVVRAHHFAPAEDDWRVRVLVASERAARAVAAGSIAAIDAPLSDTAGQILVLSPAADEDDSRRAAAAVARELRAALHGFTFAVGFSRVALDPADLYRAGNEALLAANVAEAIPGGGDAGPEGALAFEATGAYRLLLPAMSEDPGELQRFYSRRSHRWSPTTSSTRPISSRRSRPSWSATATSPTRRSGCSPTATRSATGSSACATSPGSTSARPTGARSWGWG
jgi:hypothetical protein